MGMAMDNKYAMGNLLLNWTGCYGSVQLSRSKMKEQTAEYTGRKFGPLIGKSIFCIPRDFQEMCE